MNFGRVILGGLVAGLLMNIGEYVFNGILMKNEMAAWATKHNLPAEPSSNFLIVAIGLTFVLGIVMVWLYALIRPRLGAGPKTAIVAALLMWFAICFYCTIINGIILQFPMNAMLIGIVWCLGEYIIGAVAGAWLYKEA
jgi:hypothetical protein